MTTRVTLRYKPISGNRQSLYLDFYPAITDANTGKQTRREFLNLYLFSEFVFEEVKGLDENGKVQKRLIPALNSNNKPKPKKLSPIEKKHNKEVQQVAEQIRVNRENQLNKPEIYNDFELEQLKIKERSGKNFVEYFLQLTNKNKGTTYDNWHNAYLYLQRYTEGNLKFSDLDVTWCKEFKEYLLTTNSIKSETMKLAQNTASGYFSKFRGALSKAYEDGFLQTDLTRKVEQIKQQETQRNFLTLEELNRLAKTDCRSPLLKRAALFSALTGLRFGDIKKMVWSEVQFVEGQGYSIQFTQQKTKGVEDMPISEQAASLMGERRQPSDKVFDGLNYSAFYSRHLFHWLGVAGIEKDITFHSFRHTYATLQLTEGTAITTVQKMLGHRNLQTTQIYAKVVDELKRKATEKIKLDM